MNGIHDMGGMHGFGAVEIEADEPVFHWDWERTVYAAVSATLGLFNIDSFRRGIESMAPEHYLRATYYERWLETLITNLSEQGVLAPGAVDERARELDANVAFPMRQGSPQERAAVPGFRRRIDAPPRFRAGDRAAARNQHVRGHTRLPRYVRGKTGVIHAHHGPMVFPDTNAHGLGERPQHLYTVRFDAADLWGESAERRESIFIDLWESYLLPA